MWQQRKAGGENDRLIYSTSSNFTLLLPLYFMFNLLYHVQHAKEKVLLLLFKLISCGLTRQLRLQFSQQQHRNVAAGPFEVSLCR